MRRLQRLHGDMRMLSEARPTGSIQVSAFNLGIAVTYVPGLECYLGVPNASRGLQGRMIAPCMLLNLCIAVLKASLIGQVLWTAQPAAWPDKERLNSATPYRCFHPVGTRVRVRKRTF